MNGVGVPRKVKESYQNEWWIIFYNEFRQSINIGPLISRANYQCLRSEQLKFEMLKKRKSFTYYTVVYDEYG